MKNIPTLRSDSSFVVQFNNSVSKTRAIFQFTIKFFEMHASMPEMHSAEYQRTIQLKIFHNYANVWTVNQSKSLPRFRVVTSLDGKNGRSIQTLLRGGKDTK